MANSRKHLIYLVYGRQTYHQEALFSIASAFAHLRDGAAHGLTVRVYTDDPSPYAGLPVQVREVTAEELVAWCQPHGYHFRAKHVALRDALEDADQALLIDTDTFFHSSPLRLFDRIQPGSLLCNAIGARYGEHRNFPLYRDLSPYLFERGWADDEMHQLNSGVIGLPREEAKILDRSLELMDELYPIANGAYTLEEFVLAVAAHKRLELVGCTDLIHHYWSRKQLFRAKIQAWLCKHGSSLLSAAALDDTLKVTDRLPRPPRAKRLLYKLGTLPLPAPMRQFSIELLYGCHEYSNEFDRACGPVWWEKAATNAIERYPQEPIAEQIEDWLNHSLLRNLLGSRANEIRQHLRQRDLLGPQPSVDAAPGPPTQGRERTGQRPRPGARPCPRGHPFDTGHRAHTQRRGQTFRPGRQGPKVDRSSQNLVISQQPASPRPI
ncbi:hypothetical protein VNPA110516_35570 [Pseudomonas aeruginosa]|nr:hypothetical protein VNPA110516_35570 [Pseudomonas aeruginosa]